MSASVSAGLGGQASPLEIEFKGRTVQIMPLKWKSIISAVESYLIDRAFGVKLVLWKKKKEMGLMTQEQVDALENSFSDDCVENGTYSFGSPIMMKIMGMADRGEAAPKESGVIFEGSVVLVSLFTGLSFDESIELMAAKPEELRAKISLTMKNGLPSPPKE
jgi:hypothetical protein